MRNPSWRTVAPMLLAGLALAAPAAATLNKERGKIVSTNWNQMEMQIKDPKDRLGTWHVKRDCRVRFSDQKAKFPNPKLSDLTPGMYIHFQFEAGTDLIQDIEVKEVGYNADQGGPGVQAKGVVAARDPDKGHLALVLEPGGKKTFTVDPKALLVGIEKGDAVTVLIETRNGREVVTKITKQEGRAAGRGIRRP